MHLTIDLPYLKLDGRTYILIYTVYSRAISYFSLNFATRLHQTVKYLNILLIMRRISDIFHSSRELQWSVRTHLNGSYNEFEEDQIKRITDKEKQYPALAFFSASSLQEAPALLELQSIVQSSPRR